MRRPLKYMLDEKGEPVPVGESHEDLLRWGEWFEKFTDRVVKRTTFDNGDYVSTVFLGLDHNHTGIGPPILWETMVFGVGDLDGDGERYESRREAEHGHVRWVDRALRALGN